MPAGRPSSISQVVKNKIADCFLCAFTDAQTAELVQINERTIRRMRAGQFCPEIKRAELERERLYRLKVWNAENAKSLPVGVCWMLERKYPLQFSRPEVQLNVSNNVLNQTNVQALVVQVAEAQKISSREKGSSDRVQRLFKAKGKMLPPEPKNGQNGRLTPPEAPNA